MAPGMPRGHRMPQDRHKANQQGQIRLAMTQSASLGGPTVQLDLHATPVQIAVPLLVLYELYVPYMFPYIAERLPYHRPR